MADAALIQAGGRLRWVERTGKCRAEAPLDPEPSRAAALADPNEPPVESLVGWIQASAPSGTLACLEPRWAAVVSGLDRPAVPLSPSEEWDFRDGGWPRLEAWDRSFYLALLRRRLEARLSSPEEALISLSREEERTERAVRREESASLSFITGESEALRAHADSWKQFRLAATEHHRELSDRLEHLAQKAAPNLSQLVGPRVAARLVSRAGGLAALGRMSASRLQLLGSRRRPAGGHGPRFGVLFLADRMDDVPPNRRGAFARSLAALAVIAARADGSTQRRIAAELCLRRDRRIDGLRRSAPP
ncbi:MAG: hypothetical protein L3K04_07640 [Thermoplasmata archaeon]|nr:hypothetical protein [Thermoplasmata archaeon]